jgi:TonB-linked SusC/RagA family outer membrane protein
MIINKKVNDALRKMCFALCMCIITLSLSAQSIAVNGKVTGRNGAALPGVTVIVKGSATGTVSNADGRYSVNVPDKNVTLVFAFAGFVTQEITVGDRTKINVMMATQQRSGEVDYVIEGTVYDATGIPFEGVTVYLKDRTTLGTETGAEGKFSLKAPHGTTLVFSIVGYEKIEYFVIEEKKDLEIYLKVDEAQLDEIVVIGLGTQRKISSVGAISTVDVKELQVPAPSIANMLGGKIAGIITTQISGEPGKNLADFWVRGIGTFGANDRALVLIDGLEGNLNSIDPADVESFSVLKDASATAVYGVRGANGVVLVTTKHGQEGKLSVTFRSNYSLSHITRLPEYLQAYDYANLMNEAYEVRGEKPKYSNIDLEVIKDGLDPDFYPDVNWQDEILKRTSFRHSQFASARGGGSVARYYVSLGLSSETAAYKAEKDNPYASNTAYNTYSFRSNLDMNLTKSTVMYFGTDVFMSNNKRPGEANTDYIWQAQARLTPLLFPIMYSNGQLPSYGATNLMSPYVLINRTGKSSDQKTSTMLTLALNQNLGMITEGLTLKIQGAYNHSGTFYEQRFATPAIYRAERRNNKGELVTKLVQDETKVSYSQKESAYRKYHLEGTLNYDHLFGSKHRVGGLVYYYMSDEKTTGHGTSLEAIPLRYQGISSRVTYGYKDTYLVDFNFGFTGSENFTPGQQYGFFPSIAAGWVPTGYQWVRDHLKWISFFKIRGSYGTVGNDQIADFRFPYLTRVAAGTGSPWSSGGIETVNVSRIGADNLQWEKATKSNLGIDANFLDSRITLTMDFFNDQRDGIFQRRVQVPNYVGLTEMPFGNVGKMKSWGSDGNISFTQKISKDMHVTIRANYTYSQNLVQNWEQVNEAYPYKEMSGFPHNIVRGYQSLGFFKDENDIKYSPRQNFGSMVMPGDLKYKDINGDGIVDAEDQVPLSFSSMYPLVMYGIGGEFTYKDFSVGVLLRGTAKMEYYRTDYQNGMGYIPFAGEETGNVLARFRDVSTRWIPREYAAAHGIDPSLAETRTH